MNGFEKRLARMEELAARIAPDLPDNVDGFLEALGVNPEAFRQGAGFDFIAALSETAANDWCDYGSETKTR